MVTDTKIESGGDVRVVTFEDGLVLRERIIALDDESRRLVWSVVDGPFDHHNAIVEVTGDDSQCQVTWSADLLPNELVETVTAIMERGLGLTKKTQETAALKSTSVHAERATKTQQVVFGPVARPTIHHISLFVPDLDAATRFYTDGIGLSVGKNFKDIAGTRNDHEFPFGVASVFLQDGKHQYIELHPAGEFAMSEPGFPLNHIAFAVADVDEAHTRALGAGGVAFDIPIPNEKWDGTPLDVVMTGENPEPMRMAFLLGPARELIELYQASM